jgi:hypothetical protein
LRRQLPVQVGNFRVRAGLRAAQLRELLLQTPKVLRKAGLMKIPTHFFFTPTLRKVAN